MTFNTQIELSDAIIVLDAAPFVNPQFPARATQHPIEEGSSISDHIILENTKLDIEGAVTDSASLFGLFVTKTTRKEAYQSLRRAREKRETVTVITNLDTFQDMAITNFSFPIDSNTGEVLDIKISFEQISINSSSFVQESPIIAPEEASGVVATGSQATSGVNDNTLTSALSELITNTLKGN